MTNKLALSVILAAPWFAFADIKTVVRGNPELQVWVGPSGHEGRTLPTKDREGLRCVISEIDGRYYWASRENKELTRSQAGSFVTFSAKDGSGYVRVVHIRVSPVGSDTDLIGKFDYVEHLLTMMGSITYYGRFAQ